MTKFCYYLFAFAVLITFMPSPAKTFTDLTTDQVALLSLKSFITLDLSRTLGRNWTNSSSVCSWIGVTCGLRHRRVTALDISNIGLSGTIPPHLGNLSFLVSLDLTNNHFSGILPRELSLLRRLKFISLDFNSFAGEIPPWFGHLRKLEHLSLRNNSFVGFIPKSISNQSNLLYLDFTSNSLHGEIPQELGRLHNLQALGMQNNHLSGVIPSAIYNISTLQILALTSNELSGSLPDDMCHNLQSLEGIYLSKNQLSGRIPSNLSGCRQLQVMSLSYNSFSGQIPEAIGKLNSLERLYLSDNNLNGVIPKEIGNLQNLVRLGLERNNISGILPLSIYNMSALQHLDLKRNNFNGKLSRDIGNLTMLKVFDLSENGFTVKSDFLVGESFKFRCYDHCVRISKIQQVAGVIPTDIGRLSQLGELLLHSNSFSGSIPPEIFNISTLQLLQLVLNDLSGSLPPHLCTGSPMLESISLAGNSLSGAITDLVSSCPNLIILDLGFNRFTSTIPHSLANLSRLETLLLSNNNLRSESSSSELSFITSLTNCTSLRYLEIDYNPLDGTIPPSIGNFSASIEEFSASHCKIMGSIPNGIHNLRNLTTLDLSSNMLSGFIPHTFRYLRNIQGLYLDDNNLSGPIPEGPCDLHRLYQMHLGHNQLSGLIPECIGNLVSLGYLTLDSNNLNSSIPSTLWNLKDLLNLDLSSNSLSGVVPLEIGNLVAANYINLSMNNLFGSIPNTIGKLQSVINMSLAHNRLEGSIPMYMGSMVGLVTLDLSCNNLSGLIPESLKKLQQLEYFNVSFNSLSGEIPSGGHFRNFTMDSFRGNVALCGTVRFQGIPHCRNVSRHTSIRKEVEFSLFALVGVVVLVMVVIITFILVRRQRKNKMINGIVELPLLIPHRISYYEILRATDEFNESNLLGTGSYCSVYKGILNDGKLVAIKVFSQNSETAFESFDVECEVLRNIRHRNLIKVLSSCSNGEFKALVLDYMPNANLEKWLYSHNYFLDMRQRLNIMIDIASALEYLHHDYSVPIVHCDLKPSNVLLNEEMIAHVSDFGISKLLGDEESTVLTNTLATIGYIAPEYGLEGLVSTRCDVYSYGVMLMETFTRKRLSDDMFRGDMTLKSWVASLLPHSPDRVVDPNLFMNLDDEQGDKILQCVSSILVLALKCSTESPGERINIKEALAGLQKIRRQFSSNT